jgi:ATP-dependent RNA helicase DeaD
MPFPAVHPALDRALAARGYAEPTPVQLAVVEADQKAGRPNADMLVSAQTGSGKTVAFGLALASTLFDGQERFGPATSHKPDHRADARTGDADRP